MPLQLFNSLSKKKELFVPQHDMAVSLYTCGPTVYDYTHIGNFRTYIFEDVLRRVLRANGYTVTHVMNITDVGHLTDDADAGEDKMEKGARREGKTAWEVASYYTDAFLEDARALNLLPPDVMPKATAHITEQIALIAALEQKGFTYRTGDGIYFDTSRFPDYGNMARLDIAGLQAGSRVAMGEKKHLTDFALWKFSPPDGEKRAMEWDSPWGVGFPGWHIECSAMSMKYLGETMDIHCGGVDHIPVHHTNEIAQSEAATGKPFVRWWLHGEFLLIDNGRMGKSEGNFLRLQTVRDRGFDPLAYRLFVLGAHYRSKLNFSWDGLTAAQHAYDKVVAVAAEWDAPTQVDDAYCSEFLEAMNDDLNTPVALSFMWKLVKAQEESGVKAATLAWMDTMLGMRITERAQELREKIAAAGSEVQELFHRRAEARTAKDWALSDALRDQIAALGFTIEDTDAGQVLKLK